MKFLRPILVIFILSAFAFNAQAQDHKDLTGETGKHWLMSFDAMKPYFPPKMQEAIKNASPEQLAVMKARFQNHMLTTFNTDGTMQQSTAEVSKTGTMTNSTQSGTWSISDDGKTLTTKMKDKDGKVTTQTNPIKLTADKLVIMPNPGSKDPAVTLIPMPN